MRKTVVNGICWTIINIGALQLVKVGDSSDWNETLLLIIAVPIGLINCAVILNSFYRLRKFSKQQVVYALFGLVNAAYFFLIWNELDLAGGSMV